MKKKERKGISLIVLVITIIVIIILATAIIISVLNNNPISEANKARFQSDRDNMQSIFTNTVSKVMAQTQGSIKINPGKLNEVTSGVNKTIGVANYEIENGVDSSQKKGTITFANEKNTENTYYTGKELPIYKAGETAWYVDSEGVLMLEIDEQIFGEGNKEEIGKEEEGEKIEVSKDEFNALKLKVTKLQEENNKLKSELEISQSENGLLSGKLEKLETSVEQLKESVNILQTTKLKMDGARAGVINIGSVGSYTSKAVSVTFNDPMLDTNYSVVATYYDFIRHYQYAEFSIAQKSTTGFTLKIYNTFSEATGDLVANYIAIPYTE